APQVRQPALGGPGRGHRGGRGREGGARRAQATRPLPVTATTTMKSQFEIAGRRVGRGEPCYVIAEAGVNHNCDLELGRRLVTTARESGADAIKFQSYTASRSSTRVAPRYWFEPKDPGGSQWDTFDKLDKLSDQDFRTILDHARAEGITAFSTPFD